MRSEGTSEVIWRPEKHGLFRPLSSNFRSEVTSEVIWRPLWPQRPPKKAVPGNMHIDARVIEVAFIKYDVKFDLKGH